MKKQRSTAPSPGTSADNSTPARSSKSKASAKKVKTSKTAELVSQLIIGSVHVVSSVSTEPRTMLWRWGLYQVIDRQGKRTRHLVGLANGKGRVCSAIQLWDLKDLCATTESGRVYQLVGPPGWNPDADYVFGRWRAVNGCTQVKEMTRALLRLRAMRGFAIDSSW